MTSISPHFCDNLQKKIISQIHKHRMIEENDRVMLAVSGGKDSLVMLETFAERRKHIPFRFSLMVAHITDRNKTYETNHEYISDFCKQNNIAYVEREISIEKRDKQKEKSYCFLCSWHRRKAIFDLTREYNINKLAFAHNMDDAIATLFLNMVYHGSISSLPFIVSMFNGRVQLIRPLLTIANEELETYSEIRAFPEEMKKCKYADNTRRTDMRKILNRLIKMHPLARKNIFRSMGKQFPEYLPKDSDHQC